MFLISCSFFLFFVVFRDYRLPIIGGNALPGIGVVITVVRFHFCATSDALVLSRVNMILFSLVSSPLALQAELKKDLIPLKKHLRCLYEAKQECDDTTVHIKVSINREHQHD